MTILKSDLCARFFKTVSYRICMGSTVLNTPYTARHCFAREIYAGKVLKNLKKIAGSLGIIATRSDPVIVIHSRYRWPILR